jgi:hypothetical protein
MLAFYWGWIGALAGLTDRGQGCPGTVLLHPFYGAAQIGR